MDKGTPRKSTQRKYGKRVRERERETYNQQKYQTIVEARRLLAYQWCEVNSILQGHIYRANQGHQCVYIYIYMEGWKLKEKQ